MTPVPGAATSGSESSWVQKDPAICGGEACIRGMRVPVWSVVRARNLGASDEELLHYFVVPLTPADLEAAWHYYAEHREEIDSDLRSNLEA